MKIFYFITFLVFVTIDANAQIEFSCGTDKNISTGGENKIFNLSKPISGAQLRYLETSIDEIITIPVVFHIYHSGENVGEGSNISDVYIYKALEYLNNGFGASGSYSNHSFTLDTKIRFVLASFSPTCNNPTNGIVRINANSIPNYQSNGLSKLNTSTINAIRQLSNWDNELYINIRIVNNITDAGGFVVGGDIFMPISSIELNGEGGSGTWCHEMGHSLGLSHTFAGNNNGLTCPENLNPEVDGDGVADTQPLRDPIPTLTGTHIINPCTGLPYGNLIFNFMGYGYTLTFTAGQITKMRNFILSKKEYYINSYATTGEIKPPKDISESPLCNGYPGMGIYTAGGCPGIYKWYDSLEGGTYLGSGKEISLPIYNETGNNNYYVSCTCEQNETPRTAATVYNDNVNYNFYLKATEKNIVSGETTTLYTEGCNSNNIEWVNDNLGTIVGYGSSIDVNPTTSTSYTVRCKNTVGCFSPAGIQIKVLCAVAKLNGDFIVTQGDKVILPINLKGNAPWSINVNNVTYEGIPESPFLLEVNPLEHITYTVQGINNSCGYSPVLENNRANVVVNCSTPNLKPVYLKRGTSTPIKAEGCFTGQDWYFRSEEWSLFSHEFNVITYPVNSNQSYFLRCRGNCNISTKLEIPFIVYDDNCTDTLLFLNGNQKVGTYAAASVIGSSSYLDSSITYFAGKNIILSNGFETKTGQVFSAEVQNCDLGVIIPQGLVVYFNFNNGNYLDLSGNQNNGSFFSGTFTADRKQNTNSNSILFDQYGSSFKYLRVPNSPSMSLNNAYTFAFWAKGGGYTNSGQVFFSKDGIRNNRPYFEGVPFDGLVFQPYSIYNGSDFQDAFKLSIDMPSQHFPITNGLFDKSQWNHFVVSYNNGVNSIFVNGILMSSFAKTFDLTYTNTRDLIIGGALGIGQYGQYIPELMFNGSIDDFRMYNRALSYTEVTTLYNAEK